MGKYTPEDIIRMASDRGAALIRIEKGMAPPPQITGNPFAMSPKGRIVPLPGNPPIHC